MAGDAEERMVAAGWALVRAGNSRGAVRQFQGALADNPEHAGALIGLAQARLNLGEIALGLEAAEGLLRRFPNLAVAHRLRAEALRRQKNTFEAKLAAGQAVALAPREPIGYHILALVHTQRKDHAAAIATCKDGLAMAPDHAILMAQLADGLLETRGGAVAEPLAMEALRIAPDQPFVKRIAARVALARGRIEQARALLTSILRRDARNEAAVSLYLLTEPGRHLIVRGLFIFNYWRKERRWLGGLIYVGAVLAFILLAVAISAVTRGLGFLFGFAIRFFVKWQMDIHRKAVAAHFAQYALKSDY